MRIVEWIRGGPAIPKLVVSLGIAAALAGCNGRNGQAPAPGFSEGDYLPIAQAQSPKTAYVEWKARIENKQPDEVRRVDEKLAVGPNPFNVKDAAAVSTGRLIYTAHCASCHGENAGGRGPVMGEQYLKAMDFHASGKSHSIFFGGGRTPRKWFDRVHDGVTSATPKPDGSPNLMPPFRDTLTNEQMWLSLTYLHAVVTHEASAQ